MGGDVHISTPLLSGTLRRYGSSCQYSMDSQYGIVCRPHARLGAMSADTTTEDPNRPGSRGSGDLRRRRRTRTRRMIQTEALRLFTEKGYAQTTVEEIA